MRRLFGKVILFISLVGVSAMIPFLCVNAVELLPSVQLSSTNGVSTLVETVNSYTKEISSDFTYLSSSVTSTGGVIVSVNTFGYDELSNTEKQQVMSFTLSSISNSSLVSIDKTRLYNFVAETDSAVSAVVRQLSADSKTDFYTAYSKIKPFSGFLGTLLALISIGLFAGLVFSILVDLAYLSVPPLNMLISSGSSEKPKIVTVEAYKAYLEGSDKDSKKDILFLYLGKKWKQLVAVCICILYLVSGKIWGVVADIIDLFSGML